MPPGLLYLKRRNVRHTEGLLATCTGVTMTRPAGPPLSASLSPVLRLPGHPTEVPGAPQGPSPPAQACPGLSSSHIHCSLVPALPSRGHRQLYPVLAITLPCSSIGYLCTCLP